MSDIVLSRDANYLICIIYKYYLELRDNGFSKAKAKDFNSIDTIHGLVPEFSLDDIYETCLELANKNLLTQKEKYIMEKYSRFSLSDDGIVYMENRFSNKIDKLINYIGCLKP